MTSEAAHAAAPEGGSRELDWSTDAGSERDLVQAILTQRLDEVRVTSLSLERIERYHKLGFPSATAEPLLQLRSPRDGSDSASLAADFRDGESSRVARFDAGADAWVVTAEPLDDVDAHALARRLHAEGDDVRIPLGQSSLLCLLLEAGFIHDGTLWAARLMPSLSQSVLPSFEREFSVSGDDVLAYGEQSGDLNPLHFDDEFARSHGFERRISHGMLFNGWLTRLLGTEYPGPGTIFLRNSASFFAPVYAGLPYQVRISTPRYDDRKGAYLVVAQLFDAARRHCTVSYNEVMLRQPKA